MDNRYFVLMMMAVVSLFAIAGMNVIFAQTGGGPGSGCPPNCPGTGTTGSTSIVNTLTSQLCGIVSGVRTVIGVIALVMFLIGGVLYAVGHFMPAAGQIKASMQGWAMGMILGGVIGVILVILAPFIISTILNFGSGLSALQC